MKAIHCQWVIPGIAAGLLVGGCSFWRSETNCKSVQEYQSSADIKPVVIPQGLDPPDASGKLVIPNAPPPTQPLSENAACLAKPPDYFRKATAAGAPDAAGKPGTPAQEAAPASRPLSEPPPPSSGR
jgi:hypothetical protein